MKRSLPEFGSVRGDNENPIDLGQMFESFVVIPEVPSEDFSSYTSS